MKIKRTFVYVNGSNSKFGEDGFVPNWMGFPEDFDPGFGLSIAHDMLEHRLGDKGKWHEEVMAFGAMLYTRAKWGYFDQSDWRWAPVADRTGMRNLGQELAALWFESHEPHLDAPPPNLRQSSCDALPRRINKLIEGYRSELAERSEDPQSETHDWQWERKFKAWMSHGYCEAQRRYSRLDSSILHAFEIIERSTRREHLLRESSSGAIYHGDKLTICLDDRFHYTPEVSIWLQGQHVSVRY